MNVIISSAVLYIIEAFILWSYCSHIFLSRYTKWCEFLCISICYSGLFIVFLQKIIWLNIVLFFIFNFIIIFILFRPKWYFSLFHAGIITIIMELSEFIVITGITNLAYTFYNENIYFYNLTVIGLFSKLLYFVFTLLIARLFHPIKDRYLHNDKETLILCIIPIMSVWIMLTLSYICLSTDISDILDHMLNISSILVLAINILVFWIYNRNQKKNQDFTDMQLQLQKEYDSAQYYRMLLQQNENQQILIHDIKKHLQSIALLNEKNEPERIGAYIDQIINSKDLKESVRVCDNDLLNAILNHYKQRCDKSGIQFRIDIRSGILDFMEDNDLTSLFYNLLDNAVESAEKQTNSFIELSVSPRKNTALAVLTMSNSCRTDPFAKNGGKLISLKQDKLRHGFGMKSIERISGKYNGNIQVYYKEKCKAFHTIIILKNPHSSRLSPA